MHMPLLNTINEMVPYQNQLPPVAFTDPASMAMDKPAPMSTSPSGAIMSQRFLCLFMLLA